MFPIASNYHIVVLAYGASAEKPLDVPGQRAKNCLSARQFVGWYNGDLDDDLKCEIDLSTPSSDVAVVFGHGNVALDVARMLVSRPDHLASTDICSRAMDQLSRSNIPRVVVIGRRGPLQASFTIAELREMTKLKGCRTIINTSDLQSVELDASLMDKLERPKRRITQLMIDQAKLSGSTNVTSADRSWEMKFLRSPREVLSLPQDGLVQGVRLTVNKLQYPDKAEDYKLASAIADSSYDVETIKCGLVVYSVGYRTINIDSAVLPFDEKRHVIKLAPGEFCKVDTLPNVYGCGWCVTGPKGVIASTQSFAKNAADQVITDAIKNRIPNLNEERPGFLATEDILKRKRIKWIDWQDWKEIDKFEIARGAKVGKSREKLTRLKDFLSLTADK